MKPKITIIGAAGAVGASTAFALMQSNVAEKLVLLDLAAEKVAGEVHDLAQCAAFSGGTKVVGGNDYALCSDSDLIIITAGAPQKVGETRLDLIQKNANILKSILTQVLAHNTRATIMTVANPVDVLAYVAKQVTGFDSNRVFGTGTLLDTGRLLEKVSMHRNVPISSISGYVFGEHGDSQFIPWSLLRVNGESVDLTDIEKAEIAEYTKHSAYEIIKNKGATYYAIASAIAQLVSYMYDGSTHTLPLSTLHENIDGVENVYISTLAKVHNGIIVETIMPELPQDEFAKLVASASLLKANQDSLKLD